MRRLLLLALVLFAGAASPAIFARREDPRLAAWKTRAAELRGLGFEAPVRLEWFRESDVKDVIREELAGAFTQETARRYRDAYAALGVFPPDLDLIETMLTLQAQAIAGMYSPRRKTLYVLDSLRDDASGADPSQSLIVTHELVHALQHQHFPEVLVLLTGLRGQDDVVGALSSALEGDATFTMLGVQSEADGGDGRNKANAAFVRTSMLGELDNVDGAFAAAPRLIRESLIFPYAHGTPLAAESFERAGSAGLDARLREPPLSMLRVLAPEDEDPVEFVRLPVAELIARLGRAECSAGQDNVAGALTLRVLFDEHAGEANGDLPLRAWRGDRFVQIDCGDTWELAWLTRWDSAEAAAQFATAYRAIAERVGVERGARRRARGRGARPQRARRHAGAPRARGLAARRERGPRLRELRRVAPRRLLSREPLSRRGRELTTLRPRAPVAQLDRAADF